MSTTRSKTSSPITVIGRTGGAMPALATAMSRPPNFSTVSETARSSALLSVTSPPIASVRGPIASHALRASSRSRSMIATEAPRACRSFAVSKPIPRAAPVTNATLPLTG